MHSAHNTFLLKTQNVLLSIVKVNTWIYGNPNRKLASYISNITLLRTFLCFSKERKSNKKQLIILTNQKPLV